MSSAESQGSFQKEFVWTSNGGSSTFVERTSQHPHVVSDPAKDRLTRPTGERAIGGVPCNLDPSKINAFLDRGK